MAPSSFCKRYLYILIALFVFVTAVTVTGVIGESSNMDNGAFLGQIFVSKNKEKRAVLSGFL